MDRIGSTEDGGDAAGPSGELGEELLFADRLRRAIARKGLGLERFSARLEERGISCSASTISLWRNGYTRPRRYEAQRAVHALEQLLDTEPGYLTQAPHPIVVGSSLWWEQEAPAEKVFHEGAEFKRAAESLGISSSTETQRLAMTDVAQYDEQGRFTGSRCQMVLQAARSGAERLVIGTYTNGSVREAGGLRVLEASSGARLGRRRVSRSTGQVVSELLLDAPLRRGEMTMIEYEIVPVQGPEPRADGPQNHELRTAHPLGRLVLGVDFHPDAVPERIDVIEDPTAENPEGRSRRAARLQGTRALATRSDLVQGGLRIEWSWGEQA